LVFPTRVRRRTLRHAFEEALDAAQLEPGADALPFEDDATSAASATGPVVGSLGDIAVSASYVATSSLARAYDAEAAQETSRPVRPLEAAAKLKSKLAGATFASGDLRRMRRRFAVDNHPDRVAAELRDEAVRAMADVNAEIDRALKRAGPS